jgi:hypothetical protein
MGMAMLHEAFADGVPTATSNRQAYLLSAVFVAFFLFSCSLTFV